VEETEPNPLRVGIVGVGVHSSTAILPGLAAAGLELVATCARHLDRAEAAARRFGATMAFDNVERMLDSADLHGVLVVVPMTEFADVIEKCISYRVPVLSEKPAARNAAEIRHLADAAAEAGVDVMVCYQKRFAAAYRQARSLMAEESFGQVTLGSFSWSMGPAAHAFDFSQWLYMNPVHHFDLARFMFGELEDLTVKRGRGTEHTVVVSAQSSSGAVVSLRANTTGSRFQHNEFLEVFGEGSSLFVDNVDTCILRPPTRPELVWRPNYTMPLEENLSGHIMGFTGAFKHFREVVRDGVVCESGIESAVHTLTVAARVGRAVGEVM
jgi:predicted dehydrogenase